jgi:membrane glycosyltransferase
MAMLLLPKFMGLALAVGTPARRAALGGAGRMIKSALVEILFSALLAPVLMLEQTKAVAGTLLGGCVSWGAQPRGGSGESWRAVVRRYAGTTLIGAIWALVAWLLTPALLPWLAPVLLGLLLAIPLALLSGRTDLGLAARRRGWFLTAEEIRPPRELAWLGAPAVAEQRPDAGIEPARGVPAVG